MKARRLATTHLRVEQLEGRLVPAAVINPTTSLAWSGYAVVANAGTVTQVVGSWQVPKVSGTGAVVAWVGIDGAVNNMVEQIGTLSSSNSGFTPTYFAWYQMYPQPYHQLFPVSPGDSMTASVSYVSGNAFTLTITDTSTGASQTVSATTTSNAPRTSAEWILERPSTGLGLYPWPTFPSNPYLVPFAGAQATIGGTTGPIDGAFPSSTNPRVYAITMQSGSTQLAVPGPLTDTPSGSSFSVAVHPLRSSQSPPPPPAHFGPLQPSAAAVASVSGADFSLAGTSRAPSRPVLTPASPVASSAAPTVLTASPATFSGRLDGGGGGGPVMQDDLALSPPTDQPLPAQPLLQVLPVPVAPALPLPAAEPGAGSEPTIDAIFLRQEGAAPLSFELPDLSPTGNRAAAVAGLLFALGLCETAPPPISERRKKRLVR